MIEALAKAGPTGLTKDELEDVRASGRQILKNLREADPDWAVVIQMPGRRGGLYRLTN